jgi:geranylgeranyl reductase family protein
VFDVHIIGAGPSGCIAALSAVRAGYRAIVSEEHAFAGGKPCSGLFSASGLRTLEDYIDWKDVVENPIYGADIHLGKSMVSVRRKTPAAYACDRAAFDRLLASAAENQGAKVEYGKRIEGSFTAGKIIGADGVNSATAEHFKFPKIKHFVSALKAEAEGDWDEQIVQVFMSSSFSGFFGWIIPRGKKRFEIGCGVELPGNPKKAFEQLLRDAACKNVKNQTACIIPIEAREKTAMRVGNARDSANRMDVLLVGDAAGQVKPTSGGGVLFGSWCAEIAGRTLDPFRYELEWKAKYGKELLLHGAARKILNRLDDNSLTSLGKRLGNKKVSSFLESHGEMDIVSRMLLQLVLNPHVLLP